MLLIYWFLALVMIINSCNCDYLYPNHPSTPAFPEIIINKNIVTSSGYVYPVPQQPFLPPLQDEIPQAIEPQPQQPNTYLPPVETPSNDLVPPHNDYLPPNNDFQPIAPPVYGIPHLENPGRVITPYVRVISMACLDSVQSRFFRATIQSSEFINATPLLMKSNGCHLSQQSSDIVMINLEGANVGDCGIRYCADRKMCLNLKIPTVKGLKLPEDRVISLQCIPQHSIASAVKSLGMKTQALQARTRSLGTIATGGAQRLFEPHIAIYRRGDGNNYEFNQLVEPGSTVVLGEELLLKATVKESDGWKFTKIGTVVMQQGIQQANTRKSITIIDNNGCRVDSMRSVCPEHPRQLSNRVTIIPFRAFLFQDVDSDEMLLSVRLFGCMHHEDCQAKHCGEEKASDGNNSPNSKTGGRSVGRRKRKAINNVDSTSIGNSATSEMRYSYHELRDDDNGQNQSIPTKAQNETMHLLTNKHRTMHNVQDYESHLDFRVVLPPDYKNMKSSNYNRHINNEISLTNAIYNGYLITFVILITGVLCFILLYIVIKRVVATNVSHTEYNGNRQRGVYDYFRKY